MCSKSLCCPCTTFDRTWGAHDSLRPPRILRLLRAFVLANGFIVVRKIFQFLCKLIISLGILLCSGGLSFLEAADPALFRRYKFSATRLD